MYQNREVMSAGSSDYNDCNEPTRNASLPDGVQQP